MDNENEVLCEKIINDIHAVFLKDSELSSFEIIPTVTNQNKSPVIHVDHNLGLESWCTKHVYDYAHKTIITLKKTTRYLYNDSIIKYVNVALLINPDVTSFWHIRRQLVQKNRLKVHKEFQYAALILTKKPKSSESFAYRRWLFSFESFESIDWSFEVGICDRCADKSSSNYHAWTHRQWVIQKAPHLLKTEIMQTEKFMRKHISDYSCYHYRQVLLYKLFEFGYYDPEESTSNLTYIKDLINFYLINGVRSPEDIISTLLPGCDLQEIGEEKLKSFLFCCNLAAYDIKLCDDQKNTFGTHESFDNHRRAMLKFIVDYCVQLNSTSDLNQQPLPKVPKYDYTSNVFLSALKRSEGLMGERHRKWCNIFLGFDYDN